MNKESFIAAVKELGYSLSQLQINQFNIYCETLLEYNQHTNLTAIKNSEEVYLKHFYDSLTLLKTIDFNTINSLLDIGSGAGFPGMVIKIIYPNISITLLDSNHKKTDFLSYLSQKLNLEVNIYNIRAEEFINNNRESFDIVTSRAVASLPILCELSLPFVALNGYFLAMKSNYLPELQESNYAITELGGQLTSITEFKLPNDNPRAILKIKKIHPTSLSYPRPYEKIIKKPLQKKSK